MHHKRTSSHFTLEDSEGEEDEWEREASISNVNKRQVQPNIYAVQTRILDDQYSVLSDTRVELAKELQQLQASLKELEAEEFDLTTSIDISKQEYIDSIEETLSLIYSTNNQLDSSNTALDDDMSTTFLNLDESLTQNIETTVEEWQTAAMDMEDDQKIEKDIKSLAHTFRYTEFEILDLIAQITGVEARIQALERDTSKLNSLPQMIPILRSDTERYQQDIKNATNLLGSLEQESMRPLLIKLSKLKIEQPLNADRMLHTKEFCEYIVAEMEKVYNIALRQRACQQLLEYSNSLHGDEPKGCMLKSFTNLLENQVQGLVDDKVEQKKDDENSERVQAAAIRDLLNDFFMSKKDIALFTFKTQEDMSLADQVQALKDYESKLRNKWQADLKACLDAGETLDGLKSRLTQNLYKHSSSLNDLIMTPRPYANLQSVLGFRSDELKIAISELEKKINDPNGNVIFDKLRKLFSVFYTDPDSFLEEFTRVKADLQEFFT